MIRSNVRKAAAFTLVELLVVIGIIALLISILLPSLSRARESAKLLAGQSDMRQVGIALQFYSNENKGFLPLASTNGENNWGTYAMLSRYLGSNVVINPDGSVTGKLSKVFLSQAARDWSEGPGYWAGNFVFTLKFNPRPFPSKDQAGKTWSDIGSGITDFGATSIAYPQRKLSGISDASGKIAMWDGPQVFTYNMCTEPEAINTDGWRWSWGHAYLDPVPASQSWDQGHVNNDSLTVTPNQDSDGWWGGTDVRFGYMKSAKYPHGSTTPVAFFDGHVETRTPKSFKVKEICLNYK